MKIIECTHGKCKCCHNTKVSQLGLLDSEVYCKCSICGKLRVACDKQDECNKVLKGN